MVKAWVPSVGELFHGMAGIEEALFDKDDAPWGPLERLPHILREVSEKPTRSVECVETERKIVVRRLQDDVYPVLQDVCGKIDPGASVCMSVRKIRGGIGLHCDHSSRVDGPAFIGPHVQIRHGGALLGLVVIGDGVTYRQDAPLVGSGGVVGHGVTVRRSIIRSGAKLEAFTEVVDSIIGRNVYVDAGAQMTHERFSHLNVALRRRDNQEHGQEVDTGRKKLGAIVGDNCYIGANVTMYPGVVLLPGCHVPGGTVIHPGVYTPEYFRRSLAY